MPPPFSGDLNMRRTVAKAGYLPAALRTANATITFVPLDRVIATGTLSPIFIFGCSHIR